MLVLDRLDRLLLGFLLFVTMVFVTQPKAHADCDKKCRYVEMYWWSNSMPIGVKSYMIDKDTCYPCVDTIIYKGNCTTTASLGKGDCAMTGEYVDFYYADCSRPCDLDAVGWRCEAKDCTKGDKVGTQAIYKCIEAGGGS